MARCVAMLGLGGGAVIGLGGRTVIGLGGRTVIGLGGRDGDPVGPLDGDRAAMMERPVWIAAEPRAALLRQMVPDREQYHQP